ncbi:hypothetical protein F3Y22_tig00111342pilonHSYRG00222 [Hibiscus syriacus]|uniref:Uncharacterized protein n=1 Tax=Hibiscus syriacus TaxID=106335 RepID=A0A6A2YP30_HIBSY|nr:receptor-like protein 6 [Hibiscus syriacus]KAE8681144.1 hypothetical protein F3Y22_tig00111342pilonHSYRG00222 [Hibiscus syriacus]
MEIVLMPLLFNFLHFLILIIFLSQFASLSSSSSHLCPPDQNLALLQFKTAISLSNCSVEDPFTSGPRKIVSWKEGSDCCFWDGVSCDNVTGNVIGLHLQDCQLYGTINFGGTPFHLSHLRWLNLAGNAFCMSEIPSTISQLASLTHLNLSRSGLSGLVPQEISHLSKLVSLDLSSNLGLYVDNPAMKRSVRNMTNLRELLLDGVDMYDVAPHSLAKLSSSLVSLNLHSCYLGGINGGDFPVHIFQLPNLESLQLSDNPMMRGHFPKSNWTAPLKFLEVIATEFSGGLPDSIGGLKFLEHLHVDGSGELPHSIGNLVSLKSLTLLGSFTGSIPASIGNLTQITHIHLSSGNFKGQFPFSIGKLQHISYLDLSDNNFTSQIPNAFTNLTKLSVLNLMMNNFNGQLPVFLFNLTQPISVSFSNNQLTGPIPTSISSHSGLDFLDISHNLLTGTVPSSLFTIPSLRVLDLSYNQLDGHLDDFQVNKSELSHVVLSNNKLHGPIPRSFSGLLHMENLLLSSNNMSGFLDLEVISKLKNLTYLDLSYNTFSLSLPKRHQNLSFPLITHIFLSSCNLREIPAFLRDSKYVERLDLSSNKIQGPLPKWFWGLGEDTLSYLNLSHNLLTSFQGFHPWNSLSVLDLHSNLLQGSLPDAVHSADFVLISNNKFTGEIPPSICNNSFTSVIDLSNNYLNGKIPQCLGNFSDSLMVLDLRMNNFHGVIPIKFVECRSLTTLALNGNQLEGSLPHSLHNCRKLEVIDVGNNKIGGQFPHWLGALPKLRVLILRSNKFHGAIVSSKAKHFFPMLRIMDISHNEFTGSLPTRFFNNLKAMLSVGSDELRKLQYVGPEHDYYQNDVKVTIKGIYIKMEKILTIFTTIDLSNNNFSGEIPSNIGKLKSLEGLNFSHNNLMGCIPSSIGSLTNLEWLDLSSNQLSCRISQKLLDLTFLEVLNFSYNKLEGLIPQGKQFNTFSNESYLGNSGLCGFPLSKVCNPSETQHRPARQQNVSSGSMFEFGWKVVVLGYGCGVIFGLIMGYVVFSTGKPQWLVTMVKRLQPRKLKRSKLGGRRG